MIYFIYCISIFKINRSGVVLIIVVSQGIETLQSVLSVLKFKLHVTNCFCWQSTTAESNQNFIKNEQLVLQNSVAPTPLHLFDKPFAVASHDWTRSRVK